MNFYYVEQALPHALEESNVYNPSSSFYNDQDQENNSVDIKSFLKLTFCVLMVIMCLSFSVYFSETFLVSSKKDPNSSLYGMISAYFFNEIPFSSFRYLAEDIYKYENINEINKEKNKIKDSNKTGILNNKNEGNTIDSAFINKINQGIYSGTWVDPKNSKKKGKLYLKISSPLDYSEGLQVFFRLIEGNYIDHWMVMNCVGKEKNIRFMNNNSLSGQFIANIEYGENLERPNRMETCESEISLTFSKKEDQLDDILTIIEGEFVSNSKLTFSFQVNLEDKYEHFWDITVYSIITCILSLTAFVNSYWTLRQLNNSAVYGNSISLITIGENIIWNAYGCLCHFFLTISFKYYRFQFGIPSFIYFVNFSVMDIRLLYTLWTLKFQNSFSDPMIFRRKLMQFYFMFYFIMFFSFFFVLKFYFNKPYILIALLITWMPQIIFNVYYQNKISMPIIFIIIVCLNRIFPSIYFRGYSNNFFELSPDTIFVLAGIFILVSTSLFLYSQTLFGSRWFLPSKFRTGRFDFFKTYEEMRELDKDLDNADCLICLCPIIEKNKINSNSHPINSNTTTSSDIVINVNESAHLNKEEDGNHHTNFFINSFGPKKSYCKISLKDIYETLLDFHEKSMNIHNKPLMITPCHHIFHSTCLETWFKKKKECPKCRKAVMIEMFN